MNKIEASPNTVHLPIADRVNYANMFQPFFQKFKGRSRFMECKYQFFIKFYFLLSSFTANYYKPKKNKLSGSLKQN